MSPKSTMPVIRPSSSTSALSMVKSVWTTCARRVDQSGATTVSKRSRTAATAARRSGSRMSASIARVREACWMSHSIVRWAFGWKKPRRARARRAVISPQSAMAASDRSVGSPRPRPGRTSYSANEVARIRADARHGAPIGCGAVAFRVCAGNLVRQGHREGRVDAVRVQDGECLHVQGRGILGRVRDLHDRQADARRAAQQERLVAFAAEVLRRSRPPGRRSSRRCGRRRPRRTRGVGTPGRHRSGSVTHRG